MHSPFRHCLLAACLVLFVSLSLSSSQVEAEKETTVPPPIATLSAGSIIEGVVDESNFLSYWEGVRYAKPPTGQYRFAPPQSIDLETQNTPAAIPGQSSGGHENAASHFTPFYHLKIVAHAARKGFQASFRVARRSMQVAKKRWMEFITPISRRDGASTVIANYTGPMCPQSGDTAEQAEDCLYINIYKPFNASSSSPLPVLFFIHGGGFQDGAGSDFDPTPIIKSGLQYGQPVMITTINYRLNIFGFSSSSDLADLSGLNPSGCTNSTVGCVTEDLASEAVGINLGYQDIKMAINWTYTNIAAFGGNPQEVTIWGQSAGSFGVSAQLLGHQGSPLGAGEAQGSNPPRPLFRGAIMMSGAPSGPAIPEPSHQDDIWSITLGDAGCIGPAYATAQARLNCLRQVDWTVLQASGSKMNTDFSNTALYLGNYPYVPTFDGGASRGGFLARPPSQTLSAGSFASVPIMIGDVEDEGTIFVPKDLTSTADFGHWIESIYFANGTAALQSNVLEFLEDAYPDVPAEGSPYTPTSGSNTTRYFGSTNQFKRAASLYGDLRFQSNRRNLLQQGISTNTTPAAWTWLYSYPGYKEPVYLGVPHSSDLECIYDQVSGVTPPFQAIMSCQWISFATYLDPSEAPGMPAWPRYDLQNLSMMSYGANGRTSIIVDNYRESAMVALNSDDVLEVTNR